MPPLRSLCDNSDQQKVRVRSFGVRQLAAAFASASLLAARSRRGGCSREQARGQERYSREQARGQERSSREQARGEESGSELPHTKAARSRPMETIMIATVTLNPAVDKSVTVRGFEIGKTNRGEVDRVDAGGKGINVAKVP